MVYIGVDLHRKRSHVVALDQPGEVRLSRLPRWSLRRVDAQP